MATVGTVEVIATIDTSKYSKGALDIDRANQKVIKSTLNADKQQSALNKAIQKYGSDSDQARLATLKLNDAQLDLADAQLELENLTGKSASRMNSAFRSVAKVGIGALVAATVAAGAAIIKNIGGAIDRIDTLVAFPRVLQALGVSSEEAESATDKLAESLRGLPTALGAGAKGVQGFVTSGLDVDKATRAFLAFNNAMLAASVETGAAQGTMQQLNQALSRGRIDGQEWNSIAANIPTVLQALQNETGKSKDELRELFREDPQALLDNIIRLNEEGGGGLASLEKQARDATGGIGTAFANFDNAIQRGIQNIVTNIGGGDLEAGQKKISDFISNVAKAFGDGLEYVGKFVRFLIDNKDVVLPIIVAVTTFVGVVTALATAITLASTAMKIFNLVFASNPIGLVITAIAALVAGLAYFFTQTETGRKIVESFFGFLQNAFNDVVAWASSAWGEVVGVFSDAWRGIQNIFSNVGSFFRGVWNTIVSVFGSVGIAIGNAIGGAVRGVVNSILGFAENTINGFIRAINTALDAINKIPGVNIGRLGLLNIPRLADGGIVPATPGGILANIGEGGEAEAVIPLSKLDKMIKGDTTSTDNSKIEINVSGVFATSKQEQRNVAELIATRLKEVQKSRAISGGMI